MKSKCQGREGVFELLVETVFLWKDNNLVRASAASVKGLPEFIVIPLLLFSPPTLVSLPFFVSSF